MYIYVGRDSDVYLFSEGNISLLFSMALVKVYRQYLGKYHQVCDIDSTISAFLRPIYEMESGRYDGSYIFPLLDYLIETGSNETRELIERMIGASKPA